MLDESWRGRNDGCCKVARHRGKADLTPVPVGLTRQCLGEVLGLVRHLAGESVQTRDQTTTSRPTTRTVMRTQIVAVRKSILHQRAKKKTAALLAEERPPKV
jgi:hypothetical protein